MEHGLVDDRLKNLRECQRRLRFLSRPQKDAVLLTLSQALRNHKAEILSINHLDVTAFEAHSPKSPLLDRLRLTDARIETMAQSLESIAAQPDPVGEVSDVRDLAGGVRIAKLREPLGTILLIFESRPNVAIESFGLAWKSGNALILKGGKEAAHTLRFFSKLFSDVLPAEVSTLWMLEADDRSALEPLLKAKRYVDLVIPRGGEGLVEWVSTHARMPVLKNDRGLCHLYVHEDADLAMALRIVENAKLQRPTVCNAAETLLVHEAIAPAFLSQIARLPDLDLHASPDAFRILKQADAPRLFAADLRTFDQEYLDRALSVHVVHGLDDAIQHIESHSSGHSEAIVTSSKAAATAFQERVNSAVTYWNASTRFTDGFEFGMGGEIGISTGKLHARGPIGLRELTQTRWIGESIDPTQGAIRK